jgi:hypothetical protein
MAVTNTGIVLRTITGVNESDLFLDSEATSVTTNTGVVLRTITGVHDANFVHPLGDEEVLNGDFSNGSTDWTIENAWTIGDGVANGNGANGTSEELSQINVTTSGKTYAVTYEIKNYVSGSIKTRRPNSSFQSGNGIYTELVLADGTSLIFTGANFNGSITNISVKEVLVNRESTTTNTGIVERPITGVNESDPMFPDNTISTITNI